MRGSGTSGNRGNAIPWLRALLIASIAYPLLLLVYGATVDYHRQFDDARQRLRRIADIVYEHADKVLDTHRLILSQVGAVIGNASDAEIAAREHELHDRFRNLIASMPQAIDIVIIGRDGTLLVNARSFPVEGDRDSSGRDYFIAEKEGDQRYITPILTGRRSKDRVFAIAERRKTADGSFGGVILVAVAPEYFEQFYALVLSDETHGGSSVALSRQAGDILVRSPPLDHGPIHTSPEFRAAIAAQPEAGYLEIPKTTVDGRDRLLSYRKVAEYPLYVAATVTRDAVMGEWEAGMAPHLLYGVPATVGLFIITLLALRRTQAFAAEQERRLAAEAALNHAQRLEVVGQLTGGVAHDFNNLLTAILGNLDLVMANVRDGNVRRMLVSALRAAERGAKLTESLLAFSRRQRMTTEIVDAHALLHEFAGLVRRTLPESVTVSATLDPEPLYCRADAAQLESALLNLIINARDAMAERGGTLSFAIARCALTDGDLVDNPEAKPGDFICISVGDTGCGMPPAVVERAFEPFFTTKEVGKGSGLGLSQVFGCVRQLGGHVTLESKVGEGTIVRFFLPAAEAPAVTAKPRAVAPPPRRGDAVMVVEDDDDVREVTRETLESAGFSVVTASDGRTAYEMLERGVAVDLLLTDVVMPNGMSGPELARMARQLRPELPVLLTSGYANAALAAHGAAPGEFELIGKPFRTNELIERISAALRRASSERPRVLP